VWWKCPNGPDHEWEVGILVRTLLGSGCPFCAKRNRRASVATCLATVEPGLAREWHPTLNGALTPKDVTPGSRKKVFWRCRAGHVWRTRVEARTGRQRSGCALCRRELLVSVPRAFRQFDRAKNGAVNPAEVSLGSTRPLWWQCEKVPDHAWCESPKDRRLGLKPPKCPFCSGRRLSFAKCLSARFPEVAAEWHAKKNGALRPTDVRPFSNRKVWWHCPRDARHEWCTTVSSRTGMKSGCPFCAGQRQAPLAKVFPKLARQWHPTKNGRLTPLDVSPGAKRYVWWKCPKGPDHEWRTQVCARARAGHGCPFCSGHRVSITNCLATVEPALARQWHPKKNRPLTPRDVSRGSEQRIWWLCAAGHTWPAPVFRRAGPRRTGCPVCRYRKARVATTRRSKLRR
jgi:hypothetical protein